MVKAMVQFQIANDMRIGELLAIKRVNINYEDKKLDIDGKVNWETEEWSIRRRRQLKEVIAIRP